MSRRLDQERPTFAAWGPFVVECPGCREPVAVGRDLVGRVAGCPRCHSAFVVPQPDGAQSDRRIAASHEPAAAPRPPARLPDRPPVTVRSAPATNGTTANSEPIAFFDPPVPVARIRVDQAPAADDPVPQTPPDATLAFRDPVKTIRSGRAEIEIRRLSPEEKRARQARRNLLILLVGAALLVALVVVLGARGR